jgi:hypothetical protein
MNATRLLLIAECAFVVWILASALFDPALDLSPLYVGRVLEGSSSNIGGVLIYVMIDALLASVLPKVIESGA